MTYRNYILTIMHVRKKLLHTRRSEESQALQQFSTPIALGLAASAAAAITPADLVLEPSAGTGLLAILAELAGGSLVLNELAETRAGLLDHLSVAACALPFYVDRPSSSGG